MVEHIQRVHQGNWECCLPGCEGSKSQFYYERFRTHLSDHHGIFNPIRFDLVTAAGSRQSLYPDGTFMTCKYCSENGPKSDQIEVSGDETV
jgi:hypothetical protein